MGAHRARQMAFGGAPNRQVTGHPTGRGSCSACTSTARKTSTPPGPTDPTWSRSPIRRTWRMAQTGSLRRRAVASVLPARRGCSHRGFRADPPDPAERPDGAGSRQVCAETTSAGKAGNPMSGLSQWQTNPILILLGSIVTGQTVVRAQFARLAVAPSADPLAAILPSARQRRQRGAAAAVADHHRRGAVRHL